jgi:hypothetical protein
VCEHGKATAADEATVDEEACRVGGLVVGSGDRQQPECASDSFRIVARVPSWGRYRRPVHCINDVKGTQPHCAGPRS